MTKEEADKLAYIAYDYSRKNRYTCIKDMQDAVVFGMHKAYEVVISRIEKEQEAKSNIDWEQRKYEIAKELLIAEYTKPNAVIMPKDIVHNAVQLIKELQKKMNNR